MGIEDLIKENTEALRELSAIMQKIIRVDAHTAEVVKNTLAEKEPTKPAPAPSLPPQEAAVKAEIKEEAAVTWEMVVTALTLFIQSKGRDAAVEKMKSFGIKGKLTPEQLPKEKYGDFYAELTA